MNLGDGVCKAIVAHRPTVGVDPHQRRIPFSMSMRVIYGSFGLNEVYVPGAHAERSSIPNNCFFFTCQRAALRGASMKRSETVPYHIDSEAMSTTKTDLILGLCVSQYFA